MDRLDLMKGKEKSIETEKRSVVRDFAQATPLRHLPPGCLGVILESLAK